MPEKGIIVGLSAVAVMIPFMLSIVVALKPSARPTDVRDYFLYGSKLDTGTFVTSSIGYSTQVASIFLFLLWFFSYGFWAMLVPLAWGLGYALVAWLLRNRHLDQLLLQDAHTETLHSFLGKSGGKNSFLINRTLVFVSALSTLFGLGGALVAEIDYASKAFILPAVMGSPAGVSDKFAMIFFQFLVLLFCGCYILWGGFKAAIDTDKIQVPCAYFSLVSIILILAFLVSRTPNFYVAIIATLIVLIFLSVTLSRRTAIHRLEGSNYDSYKADSAIFIALLALSAAALVIQLSNHDWKQSVSPVAEFVKLLPGSNGLWFGFGIIGTLSLVLTNLFWQLIDLSCMQRLQSVRFDGSDESYKRLSLGLRTAGTESCGVWSLVIVFAVLAKAIGAGSTENLVEVFINLPKWNMAIVPLLCFLVTAFMISTVDCFVSACAFVIYFDIAPASSDLKSTHEKMSKPRFITLIALTGLFIAYWTLREYVENEQHVSVVLYGFYSLQASIFVAVCAAIVLKQNTRPLASVAGILGGWAAGFACATKTEPLFGIPNDSWWVLPPLAAIACSFVVFVVVWFFLYLTSKLHITSRGR